MSYIHMKKIASLYNIKSLICIQVIIVSFSHFMISLFGQTIPSIFVSFVKDASESFILGTVFLFAVIWFLKTKPKNRPKNYSIVIYDIFGNKVKIDGLRSEFKTHDVAWSFMKQYKSAYSLYNFALISDLPNSTKRTIFKYI